MRYISQARVEPRSLWPSCKDPHVALLRPLALDLRWKQSLPLAWIKYPVNLKRISKHPLPSSLSLLPSTLSIQFSSVTQSCPTLQDPVNHSMPDLPVHHQLQEFTQTHVHWVGDAIQPSHPLSSPSPPALNLSQHQGLFKWPYQWLKYGSFSFNISPSDEQPGLISFRMDWLDLLAVQGTLKSLLQHHSSKASIFRHSAFFIVQLSHLYMTTGKTMALTRQTFVDKVMSLLFNMLSRLVITFLPRSKCLLISWLQSPSALILEPPKIKSATVSPSICHEVTNGCHDLSFNPLHALNAGEEFKSL